MTVQTLKDFLIEDKFSSDDIERIIAVMQRRLPRLLGMKIYRHGGSNGMVKGSTFDAILYYFGDRAFQIRMKGSKIAGIDVWDKFALNRGPSYTIDISKLNASSILASISKLAQLILAPEQGQIEAEFVAEAIQLDEMARRIDSNSFFNMAVDEYGADGAKSVTWDQIRAVADKNDVLIPAYIRSQKIGRGRWDATPGAEVAAQPEKDKPAKQSKDPILYIKVTAQDPTTKKFISAGDNKEAQALYGKIQSAIDGAPTPTEIKDPETMYGHMAQLVDMVAKNQIRSLLITGGPGTGKCAFGQNKIEVLTKEELNAITTSE